MKNFCLIFLAALSFASCNNAKTARGIHWAAAANSNGWINPYIDDMEWIGLVTLRAYQATKRKLSGSMLIESLALLEKKNKL